MPLVGEDGTILWPAYQTLRGHLRIGMPFVPHPNPYRYYHDR